MPWTQDQIDDCIRHCEEGRHLFKVHHEIGDDKMWGDKTRIREIVRVMVESLPEGDGVPQYAVEHDLKMAAQDHVLKDNSGNPVVIYVLLYIVIPILVRLVVEWWLRRKKNEVTSGS